MSGHAERIATDEAAARQRIVWCARLDPGRRAPHIAGKGAWMKLTAITAAVVLLGGVAAAQETVCRVNSLGATVCSGPTARPEPRRQIRSDVQALDRVQERPDAGESNTEFVPSYRRGSLSSTTIETNRPIGTCRADALGNLHCR
jgi:hypothetical protein